MEHLIKIIFVVSVLTFVFNLCQAQFYKEYTTNVYGRQPFQCYSCTNNPDAVNSGKYQQASDACGFAGDFSPNSHYVQKKPCYTYCLKRETGIVGSKIDVERRCEPTCQEYNGNTKVRYLIDKVSCCIGNFCNFQTRVVSSKKHISLLFILLLIISNFLV